MPRTELVAGAALFVLGCAPWHEVVAFPTGDRPHELALADLDGDGEVDIITANSADLTVLRGDGKSFAAARRIELPHPPAAIEAIDADRDAHRDLVVAYLGGHGLGLLLADDRGGYDHAPLFLGPDAHASPAACPSALAVTDLNADGLDDIVLLEADPPRLVLLHGRPKGGFLEPRAVATHPAPRSTPSLIVADVDGDGALDLLCAFNTRVGAHAAMADHIRVLRNDAWGNLVDETLYEVPHAPMGLAAGDLDGDGVVDVAVTSQRRTADLVGIGGGWLSASARHLPGRDLGDVLLVDLRGDALPDVVAAAPNSSHVALFENLGDWHFAPRRRIPVGDRPVRLAAADLDHDGKPELVTANAGSDDVSVVSFR